MSRRSRAAGAEQQEQEQDDQQEQEQEEHLVERHGAQVTQFDVIEKGCSTRF